MCISPLVTYRCCKRVTGRRLLSGTLAETVHPTSVNGAEQSGDLDGHGLHEAVQCGLRDYASLLLSPLQLRQLRCVQATQSIIHTSELALQCDVTLAWEEPVDYTSKRSSGTRGKKPSASTTQPQERAENKDSRGIGGHTSASAGAVAEGGEI